MSENRFGVHEVSFRISRGHMHIVSRRSGCVRDMAMCLVAPGLNKERLNAFRSQYPNKLHGCIEHLGLHLPSVTSATGLARFVLSGHGPFRVRDDSSKYTVPTRD